MALQHLDKLPRRLAAELRVKGRDASTIKGTRWALIKNPADLSQHSGAPWPRSLPTATSSTAAT